MPLEGKPLLIDSRGSGLRLRPPRMDLGGLSNSVLVLGTSISATPCDSLCFYIRTATVPIPPTHVNPSPHSDHLPLVFHLSLPLSNQWPVRTLTTPACTTVTLRRAIWYIPSVPVMVVVVISRVYRLAECAGPGPSYPPVDVLPQPSLDHRKASYHVLPPPGLERTDI